MSVVHVSDSDFESQVIKSEKPVLLYFWAPWCGPCLMVGPVMDELSKKYDGKVMIAKVNVDDNTASASKYGVSGIPTVILFKDGKEVDRRTGAMGQSGYEEMIKKAL